MPAAIMDTNLRHLLSIERLYLPSNEGCKMDALFAQDGEGAMSRFLVLMGSDTATRDELLVLKHDAIEQSGLPANGIWTDLDRAKTELVTLRRFLGGDLDAPVEELLQIRFEAIEASIRFERARDDWGDWKLSMSIDRPETAAKESSP